MSERDYINSNREDFVLIKAFLENDRKAFNKLVLKYKDMIFSLCYRMLGDYDEANDCSQEIFIKVYRNLNKFKFQSGFSTWLYRIAVNSCKNELSSLRFRMKKKSISMENPGYDDKSSGISINDSSSDPVYIYEKKEKEILIQRTIDTLKAGEKILIILRDIEGRSYEEIENITGFKAGTVKSKIARAREALREKLKEVL